MIVLLIRRTLTTVDRTVSVENQASANQHADPVSAFQDYDIFRAGASSPSENVAILERIVSSKDPRRGEYLQKLSAEPWLAWIEKHAISEGLDGIRTGRKVQNLFETVKAREWAKIDEMFKGIDVVDAVTLVPVFRALKYWRYLNRRNHPMFEEVEHALAFGLVGKLSMDDLKKVISKLAVSA